MEFTAEQIDLACRMKDGGLAWEPRVGHYIFDRERLCRRDSPFQSRVYFILDYACFIRHVGGSDVFRRGMVWLPTWNDLRSLLNARGVENREVAAIVATGICEGNELTRLYVRTLQTLDAELQN